MEFDHVKQLVKFYASANLILPARGLPCCRWPYRRFLNASPPLTSDISREEESNVALKKEKSEFQILALNYLFLLRSKYRSEKFPFLVRNLLLITQLSFFDLFEQKNWRRLIIKIIIITIPWPGSRNTGSKEDCITMTSASLWISPAQDRRKYIIRTGALPLNSAGRRSETVIINITIP